MILLLVAVGLASYLIAEKNVDVRARVAFDDFLGYYQNCTQQEQTDCYCDEFDLSLLPHNFHIRVVDLEQDKLGFELYDEEEKVVTASTPALPLCAYSYSWDDQLAGQFTVEPLQELDLFGVYSNYDPVYIETSQVPTLPGKILLHRSPEGLCFVRNKNPATLDISDDQLFHHVRENSPPCGSTVPESDLLVAAAQPLFP
jgi:hypothetical protein